MYLINLDFYNLVVIIRFFIRFEAKFWKHFFVESFNEAKHYYYILLHHIVDPKPKFLSKFPITKWSFVNFKLFKNPESTKYMIIINHLEKEYMKVMTQQKFGPKDEKSLKMITMKTMMNCNIVFLATNNVIHKCTTWFHLG
jgi:hypothetical protein